MRCIETEEADRLHMAGDLINYNMRCIETTVKLLIACTAKG